MELWVQVAATSFLLLISSLVRPGELSPPVPRILPSGLGEAVDRDVARVRAATKQFNVVSKALAAGYVATDRCIEHPTHGVMGLHYKNPALRDATPDVEQPEILLYQRMSDGTVKLNGVEYVVPLAAWTRDDPPVLFGHRLRRDDALGIWYLHAWIWEPNPSGIFADWNPNAKC